MFIAKKKNGELFSLANVKDRECLIQLKKEEAFYCPGCSQKLILKLGNKRMFHFAHQKNQPCHYESEPETEYHLAGKLQLYEWLEKLYVHPELEAYIKQIQQRPDILFTVNDKKYVVEFQCSPISSEQFSKRTRTYLENGYEPIWILGAKQLKRKSARVYSLSHFHSLFLLEQIKKRWTLRTYCPDMMHFITLQNITPLTTRQVLADTMFTPRNQTSLDALLFSSIMIPSSFPSLINEWWRRMQAYKQRYPLYVHANQDSFIRTLYASRITLSQLPLEVGLPVPSALFFSASPLLWQTYLFMDLFFEKQQGTIIYLQDARNSINRRIHSQQLSLKKLHFFRKGSYFNAISEYFMLLAQLNMLIQLDNDTFKLNRDCSLQQLKANTEEAAAFFKRNRSVIMEQFLTF